MFSSVQNDLATKLYKLRSRHLNRQPYSRNFRKTRAYENRSKKSIFYINRPSNPAEFAYIAGLTKQFPGKLNFGSFAIWR
jgi:hypothetical protein